MELKHKIKIVKDSLKEEDKDKELFDSTFTKSTIEDQLRAIVGDDYVGMVRDGNELTVFSWKKLNNSQEEEIQTIWEAWNG